jgi:serine/threonine protein kinase
LHPYLPIYRDLKPDNIGFDACDTVKLFDFGLAKELRESERLEDDNYKLTGMTGSRRYMAPEVAKRLPYNQSADVYSFGILLYEICSLERPFQGYQCTRHMEEVVMGKQRPKIETGSSHSFWPESLVALIRKSWDDNAHVRPNFNEVMESLDQLLKRNEPSNEDEKDTMEEDIAQSTDMSPKPPLLSNIKLPKRRRAYSWGLKNVSRTEPE